MTHKNAQQLLGEVAELLREIEVYSAQRAAFFSKLMRIDKDYDEERCTYLEYEGRQKAALRGRSREELSEYYRASIYSLLKKAEFVVSQVIAIVHDDLSYDRLKVIGGQSAPALAKPESKAKKEAALPQLLPRQSGHLDVFNIDNEIERLRWLLASTNMSLEQLEKPEGPESKPAKAKSRVNVPKFEALAADIETAEEKASRAQLERKARLAAVPAAQSTGKSKSLIKLLGAALKSAARFAIDVPLTAAGSVRSAIVKMRASRQKSRQARLSPEPKPNLIQFKPQPEKKPGQVRAQRQGILAALRQVFSPKKSAESSIFVEEIVAMEKQAKVRENIPVAKQKEQAGLSFGWFSGKSLLREFTEKFRSGQEPILAEKTAVPAHMKRLGEMRKKLYESERLSGFDSTLLAQEARRVKKILEVEKPAVYQGSSVGLLANLTVRKISLFLVDKFPEFFGFLYNALRSANVKVLSNTYVNIMILSTLFVMFSSFIILAILFFLLGHPVYQIILRAGLLSVIGGFACATIFYAYPLMKIKERRRNIMTNMPFGINHMAAVATSGVPPASMFELIAASNEYGEIGVELKKVVDFINIFGYDFLTAIRTVAATTPSRPFKEFLEGMVSTIETGGDLDSYLRQEADQAALTYNLERQRYNETVSTYSDIYTGLLIAAPLFFVAAMSLVNLLGGSLGGIGVDVVMAVGAYAVIPVLNIGFLVFLQVSQPEA